MLDTLSTTWQWVDVSDRISLEERDVDASGRSADHTGMRTLLALDFLNFAHRSWHTYGKQGLASADGTPTGVAFGMLSMGMTLIKELQPTHVVVCFESTMPSSRRGKFEDYKAQRKPVDEDLKAQLDSANIACGRMGWARYRAQAFEADDALAVVAQQAIKAGFDHAWIATGDHDLLGVVDEHISVVMMGGGIRESAAAPWTPARILEKYGVPPAHIPDYKALVGDSTDNYPGVPGIGPGKAEPLLRQYGSIANIYAHIEEIEPKSVRDRLRAGEDLAWLCLDLATLETRATLTPPFDPDAGALATIDRARAEAYLRRMGMNSLIGRLPRPPATAAAAAASMGAAAPTRALGE